ncbi:MAG: class I SAM-dependent methyltransferase [Acidimicrobiia bacterium]|nr:class I SAM-dependent methyltransferase [Acidimicrobiia bacterium]
MARIISDWKQHFAEIYRAEARTYQRMVAAEDAHGELADRLSDLADRATTIVDIGAGTGRLSVQLCKAGNQVHGVDQAAGMLEVAGEELAGCTGTWTLTVADARQLPIEDDWADAAIAGWVYGHFTEWHPEGWRSELDRALAEMDRVTKPGGTMVVVDTLGTAVNRPGAPNEALGHYHRHLEAFGFNRSVLRTDYRFSSAEESIELLDWFFGLGDWARDHNSALVPEYTGWWERVR